MLHTVGVIYVLILVSLSGATECNITGGRDAKPHSRPYMASLQIQGKHTCGGMLIRKDYVLTAAHCKNCYQDLTVVLGAHNISKKEKTQQRIAVRKYHVHPKFQSFGKYDHDIMLLKLEKNAKLGPYVKTIELPRANDEIPANVDCEVSGWGKTGSTKPESDVLREAKEKVQFDFECKNIWQENYASQHMICTTFKKNKGGVCQGDSGGPLICDNKVQGITAYTLSEECDNPKFPHVFTKVRYFLQWIKQVMKN